MFTTHKTIYRLASQLYTFLLTLSSSVSCARSNFTSILFLPAPCRSTAGRRRWSFIQTHLDYIYTHGSNSRTSSHHTREDHPKARSYTTVKMVAYRILFLAGAAAALPLNINLGAYSPALVVGKIVTCALITVYDILLITLCANR